MKSFFLSVSMVLMAALAGAQQLHFVYLQTDSRKPFYVMLNNKNYSSSSIGYVILPKLQNGEYAIKVGFPRSEQSEQEFLVQVKDNDQGFLVKDFGDKGWGLFNIQNMDIQYAGLLAQKRAAQLAINKKEEEDARQQAAAQLEAEKKRKTDSLQAIAQQQHLNDSVTNALTTLQQQAYIDSVQKAAAIASNTAVETKKQSEDSVAMVKSPTPANELQQPVAKNTPDPLPQGVATADPAISEAAQRRLTDSLNKVQANLLEQERLERIADSIARTQAAAIESAKQPDNNAAVNKNLSPKLLRKNFTDSGWRYTYVINSGTTKENIDVFIPVGQSETAMVAAPTEKKQPATPTAKSENDNAVLQNTTDVAPTSNNDKGTQFLDMSFGNSTVVKTDSSGVKVLHNSNCRAMANEKDFTNIRKKIVAADATDKMINVARKYMKEKCFTTEQIRNLSYLFLTDADRYQFLDAAYPFALDAYRFNTLQDLLKDDYFLQRFKAMIR